MEYQGRRAGMATSGRATGTRQGPAQDQTGKRSLHGSQPGSPPRSGARRYDTDTAEAMARLWAIPGAREFLPRDYTSCLINEQRRDAQAAPAAIKWQHGGESVPESGCVLDGADVLGFARQRHDAVGFWLKMQAKPVRRAILRLDEASFQTMKYRLGPDIDDALG